MPAQRRLSSSTKNRDDFEVSGASPSNRTLDDDDKHRQQQTQLEEEDELQLHEEETRVFWLAEAILLFVPQTLKKAEANLLNREKNLFVFVRLQDIRKDVQCPICLGIIKKTRTMMECLHRFCRECIDKSMRLGNNECPACQTHCKSRRSLRDDPNYDALISALYPDIEKYEKEELAFHEEEKARNKIQASITEIFRRQSEALVKRLAGKESTTPFSARPRCSNRGAASKRRQNGPRAEHSGSDDNEHVNEENGDRHPSSNDENNEEPGPRRRRRRLRTHPSQPSPSTVNSDGLINENGSEVSRECRVISPRRMSNPELLAWGRGGARSNTRYGNANGSNKSARRVQRLKEHFQNLHETAEIHLSLIPANSETMHGLERPFLSVPANLMVNNLCEFISRHSHLAAEEVEILVVKAETNLGEGVNPSFSEDQLQLLAGGQQTLRVLDGNQWAGKEYTLAFRRKKIAQ